MYLLLIFSEEFLSNRFLVKHALYQLILRGFVLFFCKHCTLNSDQRSVFFYVFSGFFFLGFQCVVHIWAEEQNWPHFSEFKVLHFGIKLFFFSYL